jgi:hypothetical protein
VSRAVVPALLATVVLAACATDDAPAVSSAAQDDVRALAAEMERVHPDLFHTTPRAEFRRAVDELVAHIPTLDRDSALVEIMRLAALPGPRDGHTGLFPLHPDHARPLHLYPLRLWSFPDGLYVVAAPGREDLVGSRLVGIDRTPVVELVEKVRPLVSRDNDTNLLVRLPEYVVTAEVLHGLGVTADASGARFQLIGRDGRPLDAQLTPLTAAEYVTAAIGSQHQLWRPPDPPGVRTPLWLRHSARTQWFQALDRGRVLYVAYTMTTDATYTFARNLLKRARRPGIRRVIVDVRLNGGGDNTTYSALLGALANRVVNRPGRLVVLAGRATYSAAGNFVAEVEASTRARFVGEPPGGSPHNYGDATQVALPSLGWTVNVATTFQATTGRQDDRLALPVDVPVGLSAADYFAGRDPVLERAVRLR